MRRRSQMLQLITALVLVAAALVVVACGDDESNDSNDSATASSGGGESELPSKTIGVFAAAGQAEVVKRVSDVAQDSAKALGWDVQYVDGEGDPAKMQQRMQALVNSKVDAIVGVFMEPALVAKQLQAAKTAGIPVVNTGFVGSDSPLVAGQYIGDQTKMANLLLESMKRDLASGSKVAALNLPQYVGVQQRVKAFDAAADAAGWDVVARHDVDITDLFGDTTKAGKDIINANPDLDAFFSCCDFGGQALAPAIQQSGKDIPVFTFYAIPSVMDLVRAGKVTVVEEDNAKTGAMAIDALARHFADDAPIDADADLGRDPIQLKVVTADNAPPKGQDVYPLDALLAKYHQRWQRAYGVGG